MTKPAPQDTGILIGASSYVDAAEALRLISSLTGEWRPRLGGLFIEEAQIAALCCMPNQRVVTTSGALAVAPSLAQIKTIMEADARAFRTALAGIAEGAGLPWSFEREMGDLLEMGLQMAVSWDILVLAHRSINAVTGKVVVLEPAARPSPRAEALGDTMARQLGAERVIFPMPQESHEIGSGSLTQTLRALEKVNAQALVIDASDTGLSGADDLRRLTDAARCPVFVIGLAKTERSLLHNTQIPHASDGRQAPDERQD